VLVIPGLRGSGEAHWQTWLQAHFRDSVRVRQDDWDAPDIDAWSTRIGETIASQPPGDWVAVAHSFGCLALAHHLARRSSTTRVGHGVAAALFVAPADPARFASAACVHRTPLGVSGTLLGSDTDPWMTADDAREWAQAWQLGFVNLGDVGHINVDAGFGPLPRALHLTRFLICRVEQGHRLSRAHARELSFAV
jgi:uncharacterized protein